MPVFEDLLLVQEHDTAADRLRHRRETLPELQRLAAVQQAMADLDALLEERDRVRGDAARRQKHLEDELAAVEAKLQELDKRLYSGIVSAPRELQALQADIASLKRRRSDLEDQALEAMQEREPLDTEVNRLIDEQADFENEAEQLGKSIAEATGTIDAELAAELEARTSAAEAISEELLSQYERLRTKLDGVGAARLVNGRCTGCHLSLPATEVDRIKREPPDAVVLCDQCGRILVR
jgi:predicted  nucleic acid-binding Zn-ribbon protein